jgi:polysaccharide export outer membrane protein
MMRKKQRAIGAVLISTALVLSAIVLPAQDAPSGSQPAADESYVIGPADMLTVTVWKETALSGNLLVRPDGMITVPLIGDLKASGSTPLELSARITENLKHFLQSPEVTVVILQVNSKKVYLLGEVVKKGPVEMTPKMTLLQAIATAGGVTEFANTRKIYILRNQPGHPLRIPVHYKEALRGNDSMNLPLEAGDTVVVP